MLIAIAILIFCIPLLGYLLLKSRMLNLAYSGWLLAIAFIFFIHFFVNGTALERMLLLIISTFWSMKIVVAANHLGKHEQLNFLPWCVFCYTWFGMNPAPFKAFPAKPFADAGSYILKGMSRIIIGLGLIALINLSGGYLNGEPFDHIRYLFYLVSLSLILHFGILTISAGTLRYVGINVSLLFKSPIRSRSLQEFWSKRWNLAFVELTTIAVLRPAKKRFGDRVAFWVSYVFSGLLHELAISMPVKTGYGKPFLFFIIQAVLIMGVEKHVIKEHTGNIIRLLWLMICLFLPIFILFHEQFILRVVLPLVSYLNVYQK